MKVVKTLKLNNDTSKPTLQLTQKNLPTVRITPNTYLDPRLISPSRIAMGNKGKISAIGRVNT